MNRYIPKSLREKIKNRFQGRCGYCGEFCKKVHIDHIVPIAKNGTSNCESNLMPSCAQCNNLKLTYNLEDFRDLLSTQVDKARKYSVNFRFAEKYGQIIVKKSDIKFYFENK